MRMKCAPNKNILLTLFWRVPTDSVCLKELTIARGGLSVNIPMPIPVHDLLQHLPIATNQAGKSH